MTVGVLLVTHGQLGRQLLDTVEEMIGGLPLPTETLEIHRGQDPDKLIELTRGAADRLDRGGGVLLLTDAFGSTPSNIACAVRQRPRTCVIAGLNLPMLVRIFNYPQLDLERMAQSAIEGGRQGIVRAEERNA